MADELLATVKGIIFDVGQLLADGQGFYRAQQGQGQGGHKEIAQGVQIKSGRQGKGRNHAGDGPHQGHAALPRAQQGADGRDHGQRRQ